MIDKAILHKIKEDIITRSKIHNIREMNHMGHETHEFDYKYCTSPVAGLENYYFVVSKVFQYHNHSLDDFKYVTYAYDSNGDYIEDPAVYAKCKGTFFTTLSLVE